jgi:hypothetical protein
MFFINRTAFAYFYQSNGLYSQIWNRTNCSVYKFVFNLQGTADWNENIKRGMQTLFYLSKHNKIIFRRQYNFALIIIMFMLNISFEIWSWLNFFRLLEIRIFSWWIIWVAMVNMICCIDFIERRIGMKISNEVCKRCSIYQSIIKLYSEDNNMDPKQSPPEISD